MLPDPRVPVSPLARMLASLATITPLTCYDCGGPVLLQHAVTARRGPEILDLCPDCAMNAVADGVTFIHPFDDDARTPAVIQRGSR